MHKVVSDLLRQRALLVSLAIGGLYDPIASAPQAPREHVPVRVVVFDDQYGAIVGVSSGGVVATTCPLPAP